MKVQQTMTSFKTVRVEQIGRNLNSHPNALAMLASVLSADFKQFIPIETLTTPSIAMPICHIHTITVGPCWMDPYVQYLKEGVLPEQKKEAEIIRRKSHRGKISGTPSPYPGILVALHAKRCCDLRKKVRQVSKVLTLGPSTSRCAPAISKFVAIRTMGYGPGRPITKGNGKSTLANRCYRSFHKVG